MTEQYLPININNPRLVRRIDSVSPPQVVQVEYDDGFVVVDTTVDEVALELPLAPQFPGWPIIFKADNAGSTGNFVTLIAKPGQNIDGLPTISLTQDEQAVFIKSDGGNWRVISNSGGGAPGAQSWAQTLAIGNPSGGTSPVIDSSDQIQFIWTGPDSQVARNRLDPANAVDTVAFDIPFVQDIPNPQGGGANILLSEILRPAVGGGNSTAILEVISTLRFQTNLGVEVRQGYLRGEFRTGGPFPNIAIYEKNGIASDFEITSGAGELALQYIDNFPAQSARAHGIARVAASAA